MADWDEEVTVDLFFLATWTDHSVFGPSGPACSTSPPVPRPTAFLSFVGDEQLTFLATLGLAAAALADNTPYQPPSYDSYQPDYQPKPEPDYAPKYEPSYEPTSYEPKYEPAYKPAVYKPTYPEEAASYQYNYEVRDEYAGLDFGANEAREASNTNGGYNVLLPDGRTQKVTYTVNGYDGYVADVQYEGEPKYEPKYAPKYAPAYIQPSYN
eukprot:maker-scaffold646_size120253-snap-gene-0.19 protein:Tk08813 transcript:maker-scaffold646_size120253-snap-gene-0.19-mRNA-1 annotation:"bcs-1 protein"